VGARRSDQSLDSVDQLCSDSDFGVYLIIRRRGSTSSIAGLGDGRIKSGGILLRSRGHSRRSLSRLQRGQVGLCGRLAPGRLTPVCVWAKASHEVEANRLALRPLVRISRRR